jgi:AraC-like DNA-binding protein
MIAIFVNDRLVDHVRHVLAPEGAVVMAHSWRDLDDIIRREAISVIVADPMADGILRPEELLRLVKEFPSLPLVAYVGVSARPMRAVVDLSQKGLQNVVFHRFDDSPARFATLINQLKSDPVSKKFLAEISDSLHKLPTALVAAVEDMFERPRLYTAAQDLAVVSGVPSVKLYRSFQNASLGSPKRLLIAAKLLRASVYLRDPGYSVANVAAKVGYKYSRKFTLHCTYVFGGRPARVRGTLTEADSIRLVSKWFQEGIAEAEDESLFEREGIDAY